MKRVLTDPRIHWQRRVEELGLIYHSTDKGQPYWDESAYYEFSRSEIDLIEQATYALNDLCLKAVESILLYGPWEQFGIHRSQAPWLKQSWERDEITIYGRFDLLFDGVNPPKLLEFNADTPTALLEAAVIQWHWKNDKRLGGDQFNTIHERLIEAWRAVKESGVSSVAFTSIERHPEDFITANYMQDVALQGGLKTQYFPIQQIGWNSAKGGFLDAKELPLEAIFKLYPWEWMVREQFGRFLPQGKTRWFEPPWKMLLSNKALLPWLWQMNPDHPNLLPASWELLPGTCVKKPILGREGANVRIDSPTGVLAETPGEYGNGPFIYQEFFPTPHHDGRTAVIGSWLVNGWSCGIGIREDDGLITTNTSRFVPHLFF